MELKIKLIENNVVIGFNKRVLQVNIENSSENTDWNTKGINNFLIDLSSATDLEEKITISADESDNPIFQHIVSLFQDFANEYNK